MFHGRSNKYMPIILIILIMLIQISWLYEGTSMSKEKDPTAIVVDDETGKPIEGAVAIAIWRKHTYKDRWFEGGTDVVVRIEEAVSDKGGRIYIDDFFGWYFLSYSPHLTIYKFGYVCWDQEDIYINETLTVKRQDFDKKHRTARLKRWPEEFSFAGHWSFINSVTRDYADAPEKLFLKAFDYEMPYVIKENREKDENQKARGKNE